MGPRQRKSSLATFPTDYIPLRSVPHKCPSILFYPWDSVTVLGRELSRRRRTPRTPEKPYSDLGLESRKGVQLIKPIHQSISFTNQIVRIYPCMHMYVTLSCSIKRLNGRNNVRGVKTVRKRRRGENGELKGGLNKSL